VPPVDMSGFCAARRALLLGVGVGGLATLAGCGGTSGAQAGSPANTGAGSAAAPQGSASAADDPFGAFPSSGGGGDNAPANALVATKEVPVGGGVLAQGSKLVVQPKAGTFKAFSAVCPHEGVTVNPPATGSAVMQCPGHNSQFKTADGGLVRGPATRGLTAIPVKVSKGYVVET
jgi:Rieske Fe-S protein